MELLYLWIEDYKNIKQQGFNFSPLYDFEFKPDNFNEDGKIIGGKLIDAITEAERTKKTAFYKDFFNLKSEKEDEETQKGTITNVTAIVGENGAGKSSVLEFILYNSVLEKVNFFLVYKNDTEEIFEKNIAVKSQINKNKKHPISENDETKVIYYDNMVLKNNPFGYRSDETDYADSSTSNYIKNYKEIVIEDPRRQAKLINKSWLKELPFLNSFTNHKPYLEVYIENDEIEKARKKFPNIIENNLEGIIKLIYYKNLYINNTTSLTETGFKTLEELENYINLKSLLKNYTALNNLLLFFNEHYTDVAIDGTTFWISLNLVDKFLKFISPSQLRTFIISWTLVNNTSSRLEDMYYFSSGEIAMLNIFSRLLEAELAATFAEQVIIVIDEGELGLHPQWQKQYLKILLETLPKIFEGKQIQLILTSHSPFLVSDLPKENVIFLEKEENTGLCKVSKLDSMKHTFGANIHTLLTDSFFMKGGLVGEFAQSKIDEVIKLLDKPKLDEKETEHCEMVISMVGEPIVKTMLRKLLDSKRLRKVDEHSSEIEKLRKRIEDLENDNKKKNKNKD
jgi:predicted ATPase